jgi:branched-chain amino acid transport system substrate-binding protein
MVESWMRSRQYPDQMRSISGSVTHLTLTPGTAPGLLMEANWDENDDIDRAGFLAEIGDGEQKIAETLRRPKRSKAD